MTDPLKVFISYAHEDEAHRETLGKHLRALVREGLIAIWHDRQITGGQEWAGVIDATLRSADIVLLLVSADFLDSDYCNDLELTEAIRLHDAGQTRVVPVILRSCDWKHSKFARFGVLPPDGVPIVEAEHPDRNFMAVAQGLRAVVRELRAAPRETSEPAFETPRLGRMRALPALAIALLLAGTAAAAGIYLITLRPPLTEARDAMRMARYDTALDALAAVPGWLAWWPEAGVMRGKAGLGAGFYGMAPDRETLGRELRRQSDAAPGDADLLVLDANYRLYREDYDQARALADAATRADEENAEAWFLLGLERDLTGDKAAAIPHYRKAIEAAPDSPQYRSNLARALLDTGQADAAIREYRRIGRFPLARVEQALGHWAKGEMREAAGAQRDAVQMLDDAKLMDGFYNRREWLFLLADKGVGLGKLDDKRCYALLGEAASRRLAGEAGSAFPPEGCTAPTLEVRWVLADHLCRFVDLPQPDLAVAAGGLRRALGEPEGLSGTGRAG